MQSKPIALFRECHERRGFRGSSAGSRMHCLRDWSNRFCGAMEVECEPSSKHLVDEIKNKDDLLTLRSCARTFISRATMSIIESLVVLERLIPRGNQSVTSRANGRRASFVERRLRLVAAPRERSGCSPASQPPEGTSWPSSRCIGPDGSPVGGAQQLRLPWFACYIRV